MPRRVGARRARPHEQHSRRSSMIRFPVAPLSLLLIGVASLTNPLGARALGASDAAPASTTQPVFPAPPNLVVDGIPPIPAAVAEEAARFTEFRSAGLAAWHPVRREVLI